MNDAGMTTAQVIGFGMFGMAMFVVQTAITFAVVYLGARLAIRHERRSADHRAA